LFDAAHPRELVSSLLKHLNPSVEQVICTLLRQIIMEGRAEEALREGCLGFVFIDSWFRITQETKADCMKYVRIMSWLLAEHLVEGC
jgi:hypothetical protein